jgi:hypothetical protein
VSSAPKPSQDVSADAGLLVCDKAAVLRVPVKETSCILVFTDRLVFKSKTRSRDGRTCTLRKKINMKSTMLGPFDARNPQGTESSRIQCGQHSEFHVVLSHDGSAANFGNDAAFAGQKQRGTW